MFENSREQFCIDRAATGAM